MDQNSENTPLSRKEREKQARQEEILNAARILFSQKGYHETTLEEIAHKAEFAKGTIYNYFANKDELFFGIIDSIFTSLISIARRAMSAEELTARDRFTFYTKEMMRYSLLHSDFFKIMMRDGPRPAPDEVDKRMKEMHERDAEAREYIARVLQKEMNDGRLRQIDPAESALLFDGMVKFYCMHNVKWSLHLGDADIDRMAEHIVSLFFDGIKHT